MKFHELASIFPPMGDDEYQALLRDIENNGLLESIWLYEDKIIDGRNRYLACLLKIPSNFLQQNLNSRLPYSVGLLVLTISAIIEIPFVIRG